MLGAREPRRGGEEGAFLCLLSCRITRKSVARRGEFPAGLGLNAARSEPIPPGKAKRRPKPPYRPTKSGSYRTPTDNPDNRAHRDTARTSSRAHRAIALRQAAREHEPVRA